MGFRVSIFYITGRPGPQIRPGFRLGPLQPTTEVLRLRDIEHSSVDSDIKLFFRTHRQLADVAKTRSDCNLVEGWPNPSDVDILCMKAVGLFIYAAIVIELITSKYNTPTERLTHIISLPQSTVHERKSGIDLPYA